jgi:hypothetical protein
LVYCRIRAFGRLCCTIFLRMSIPILQGKLSKENEGQSDFDLEEGESQNTVVPSVETAQS